MMFVATAMILTGCGGGDSDDKTTSDDTNSPSNPAGLSSDDPTASMEPAVDESPEAVSRLPFEPNTPADFEQGVATCDVPKDAPDPEPGTRHPTWITYAVPTSWDARGWGSGGSGGATGTSESLSFSTDGGSGNSSEVEFSLDWEQRDQEGNLTHFDEETLDSFDYESSIDDDTVRITYEKVGTVTVGEQDVELFFRDPAQSPKHVSRPQYKARVMAFEWPQPHREGALMPESFVVSVDFSAENPAVTQDVVESVLTSYAMPACTWDDIIDTYELMMQVDMNGDGEVRNAEDLQKEMQETLEELQAKLEEEQAATDD